MDFSFIKLKWEKYRGKIRHTRNIIDVHDSWLYHFAIVLMEQPKQRTIDIQTGRGMK